MSTSGGGDRRDPIRVVIVDDQTTVRQGVGVVLRAAGVDVCGEAQGSAEAVKVVDLTRPDVVVMDIRLADRVGIEAIREIRSAHPSTQFLMLSALAGEETMVASALSGASGYALKEARGEDLVEALQTLASGRRILDPAVVSAVLGRIDQGDGWAQPPSHEELQILSLIGAGRTDSEIAGDLSLEVEAVRRIISAMLSKLKLERLPRRNSQL